MSYKKILQKTYDLHVHIGPEIIPRKFDLTSLIKSQSDKLAGIAVKNHFFPTIAQKRESRKLKIIYSVSLNRYCGGFNSGLVKACAQLAQDPILVWFPTISARNFLEYKEEIPKEWIGNKAAQFSRSQFKGYSVFNARGRLRTDVIEVLKATKDVDAILATGHISWQESMALIKYAKLLGIKRIIVTHPIYQAIRMPLNVQIKLAKMGALIEQCYSMFAIDNIPIKEIANQIKAIGAKNCIISSDVGQAFSKNPNQALEEFCRLLAKERINKRELKAMLIINPKKLINRNLTRN